MIVTLTFAAFVLGFVFATIIFYTKTVGTLEIDDSDPDVDKYMLEISEISLNDVKKRAKISFRVENKRFNE